MAVSARVYLRKELPPGKWDLESARDECAEMICKIEDNPPHAAVELESELQGMITDFSFHLKVEQSELCDPDRIRTALRKSFLREARRRWKLLKDEHTRLSGQGYSVPTKLAMQEVDRHIRWILAAVGAQLCQATQVSHGKRNDFVPSLEAFRRSVLLTELAYCQEARPVQVVVDPYQEFFAGLATGRYCTKVLQEVGRLGCGADMSVLIRRACWK